MSRNSIHNSPDLFGAIRADRDCRMTEVNQTLANWVEYEPDELVGTRFDSLLDGAGRLFFEAQCLPSLEIGHSFEEVHLSLQTRSGERVPALINAVLHTGEEDSWIEFGIVRMSRRARIEDELLRAKKLAVQADQAKSRFLGVISHELRTPIQTISMGAEVLLGEGVGPLTDRQRELLEGCREAGSNLSHLINDILDFARLDSGKVGICLEVVSANDCLKRTWSLLKQRIEASEINLRTEFHDDNPFVTGDSARIQQILLNLVTNAIKFTPEGGQITTRVAVSDDGHTVTFEVEDTGCGIEPVDLTKIFEAFVQVGDRETRGKGIGLGLAISRDLAHAMKGEIRVSSIPGEGSTFSLGLPKAAE
ncbi:MAG: hypothetical protein HKN23_11450 [Verrucomicrobiales bacterium]|nr:hypothetical protein [Verrucomicrobiales bacterium]